MNTLDALRLLEAEYPSQPPVARRADLAEINRLRAELGMPAVDASLRVPGDAPAPPAAKPAAPKPPADHTEARAAYAAFLRKQDELRPHREYADRVARATGGPGMTPVEPLATMGCGGGPLLCDVCGKPLLLEGGRFNKVYADAAWAANPQPGWRSWISGGMVVDVVGNGTLRVYHGYPRRGASECCEIGSARLNAAEAAHVPPPRPHNILTKLWAFLADERPDLPEAACHRLASEIVAEVYGYDPGPGRNRPE